MCQFTRSIGNTLYAWDLAVLAAGAGSEYIAWKDGCNPAADGSGDPTVCPPKYDPNYVRLEHAQFSHTSLSHTCAQFSHTSIPFAATHHFLIVLSRHNFQCVRIGVHANC